MISGKINHIDLPIENTSKGLRMLKTGIKGIGSAAAALLIASAAPAYAGTEVEAGVHHTSIAKAKSMMVKNPGVALDLARGAKHLIEGKTGEATRDRLTANWLEGEALLRLNRSEEAATIIRPALAAASRSFAEEKIYADLLRSAASLEGRTGNSSQALAFFMMAEQRYEQLGDARSQAIVLQNIGSLYSRAKEYEETLRYYSKAATVFSDDAILSLSAHNNIGNALRGMKRFDEAEAEFGKALVIAEKMSSPILQARILTNLASAQQLGGAVDQAEETANRALGLAEKFAADWTPFIYGVLAQIELDRGNLATAEEHINRTFADVPLNTTNALFRDFHETASEIFELSGNVELAGLHTSALDRLNREASEVRLNV